ncbi:zinc-finger homeodomain protein 9-like [Telopea speciosissima]|uniref:zinc-finger homeodomain protein 9-like n=1 Tax=Telopea speciosissima TaxID=54955 RepID=UPI001CC42321|nr:zinc-finger homeodomain protein 9-like [Telopea speciosissima]
MNLTLNPTTAKAEETESDTPPPIQLPKSTADHHTPKTLSIPNGILKRIQKNHAASLDGHTLDGCGEFMPSPSATLTDPTSLKCAACGCHRNFQSRESEVASLSFDLYQHHYHPSPHPSIAAREQSPNSPSSSPPPLSSSYYPSAPQMLLALSTRLSGPLDNHQIVAARTMMTATMTNSDGQKWFRTKFNQEQKEKMFAFSERLGWKMQKKVPLNFVRRQWLALQMGW